MNSKKKLASAVAVALAAVTLSGTSVFAEERHRDATDSRQQQQDWRSNDNRRNDNDGYRNNNDRNDGYRNNNDGYRNNNDAYRRNGNDGTHGRSISERGRVTRINHERDGYRVWLDRGNYSYFVPEARWRVRPLRVGISVILGGYYDPRGYVYTDNVDAYGLRGYVERVDFRRGEILVRDDYSRDLVTVVMRGRDRDFGYLNRGDYVEIDGDWNRGIFEAYRIDPIGRHDGYGRRY